MDNLYKQWTIYWNEYTSDAYLYGSEISFLKKDEVLFENAYIPPGTIMNKWYSHVNYQAKRIEPTLPIIDGDGQYYISSNMESDVDHGAFLRLLFMDKNGEEVGSFIVRDNEASFTCPKATNHYEVQLICAGAHRIIFHSFTIAERD